MTLEELCKQLVWLQHEIDWIALQVVRMREIEMERDKALNDAAEYFPRVRGSNTSN